MLTGLKQLKIDKRIRFGYGTAFILLFISYLLTLCANRQLVRETKAIINSNHTVIYLQELVSNVKEAQSSVIFYLLLRDKKLLDPYKQSNSKVDSLFSSLNKEVAEDAVYQNEINDVKKMVILKYQNLFLVLKQFKGNDIKVSDSMINTIYQRNSVMDSIDNTIKLIQLKKINSITKNTDQLNSRYRTIIIIIIISLILGILFALFGFLAYLRENHARKIADGQVIEVQKQLEMRITELDAANNELVQMRRIEKFAATGRIARNIAHEVRNPLTNIDLAIGQIRSDLPDIDENFTLLFDMVNRNSKRINQLITELLNATRFAELNYQPVSINNLLDEALDLAKDRIALTHVEIKKDYAKNLCDVFGDKEKLRIAFLNIIVNAVEATEKEGGILNINSFGDDKLCIVEIIDNGIGMDSVALSKLFEPYFTTKQKGNGLGLTNTQNIILNHKGTLNVESTPGTGTTFTIKFLVNPNNS